MNTSALPVFLFALMAAFAAAAPSNKDNGGDTRADCDECFDVILSAEGGMQIEYSRYMGRWNRVGMYNDWPFYMCTEDCQGLQDQLIRHNNVWTIVDCRPDDADACGGGAHHWIETREVDASNYCPYHDLAPFKYCDGEGTPGGGCTHYEYDETAKFTCV